MLGNYLIRLSSNHGVGRRRTDDFNYTEGEADGRICEGHDSGDDREPPNLVEVWNLRQEHLRDAKRDHLRIAGAVARTVAPSLVEAIRPLDCPASLTERQKNRIFFS